MPTDDQLLDVRSEVPQRRHDLIFETFAGLAPGAGYVLVNDHDPKPLRYYFEAEHAGEFTWEYLEEGPQVWRVRGSAAAVAGREHRGGRGAGPSKVVPDWRSVAQARADGPGVSLLHLSHELKVVLVSLAAGQSLPDHPGPAACFHFLAGEGEVVVDGQAEAVSAGATVIVPPGAQRGVRTASYLVFLGNLGDPDSEHGPH